MAILAPGEANKYTMNEVEKIMIHHSENETHGFQGLVDQNDRGKAEVPKKITGEFRLSKLFRRKARNIPMHKLMKIFFI